MKTIAQFGAEKLPDPDLNQYGEKLLDVVKDLGLFILKTLVAMNSGGAVVMLTFVGNAREHSTFAVQIEPVRLSMIFFCSGVVISMTLAFVTYIRNVSISLGYEVTHKSKLALLVYIGLATSSLACFCIAVMVVAVSIGP